MMAAHLAAAGVLIAAVLAQPAPTPTPRPAPTDDRVGFPEGYQTSYETAFVLDRPDNKQVRVVYANPVAATTRVNEQFPYGSILVMETYRAVEDGDGAPILDDNGRYQRGDLTGIFVMRKEQGFGSAYEMNRTGEWEYVAFRPDKTYSTPPRQSANCAVCHTDAGGTRDWVYRADLFAGQNGDGSLPQASTLSMRLPMRQYAFVPSSVTVPVGTILTWANEDAAVHTVTAADSGFDSGRLAIGDTFSATFSTPGTYEYGCSIHAGMKATVVVQ